MRSESEWLLASNLYTSRVSITFATNFFGTLVIAYQLWKHRQTIVGELGLSRKFTKGQKVLLYLVESGALYCALQVTPPFYSMNKLLIRLKGCKCWSEFCSRRPSES
jgi:hypothetical protein